MTREETIALYSKGRIAWNEWAEKMLAKKEHLKERGIWAEGHYRHLLNKETRTWHEDVEIEFSEYQFAEKTDFYGFIFPGNVSFEYTIFSKDIEFMNCIFCAKTQFHNAIFQGIANFSSTQFNGDTSFSIAEFKKKCNIFQS